MSNLALALKIGNFYSNWICPNGCSGQIQFETFDMKTFDAICLDCGCRKSEYLNKEKK